MQTRNLCGYAASSNPSFPSYNDILKISIEGAKEYSILKFKQDQQYKITKSASDLGIKIMWQSLQEEGLSLRKINACRVMYEKSIDARDVYNLNELPLSNKEKAQGVLLFVYEDFGNGNATINFKSRYYECEELILEYYENYFNNEDKLNELKRLHSHQLNIVKQKYMDEGVPLILMQYVYKRLRADISVLNVTSQEEHRYFDNLYTDIRSELIGEVKQYV